MGLRGPLKEKQQAGCRVSLAAERQVGKKGRAAKRGRRWTTGTPGEKIMGLTGQSHCGQSPRAAATTPTEGPALGRPSGAAGQSALRFPPHREPGTGQRGAAGHHQEDLEADQHEAAGPGGAACGR